ncbi:dihydrolipoyl dehydrogenase [Deinococcus pimensis]|uniref:dihydrolipoyl dehydrogenase n=1 Tax=Deinococcus pimensis TaxID=309888 RepID=UPI0004857306|nr:dihydrolipoyl dehydrogenase [Deinococcus pimensis]
MDYDLLVIGAGPGGYHAAIRAAQLGLKVACAEMGNLGGVCLNIGCIPTKALLHAGEEMRSAKHAADFGLSFGEPTLDIAKLNGWKDGIVKRLTGGVGGLFKANKVTHLVGQARFLDANTVQVGDQKVTARNVIIATGSDVAPLPGFPVDQNRIIDSTGALVVPDPLPKRMLAIGAGAIGLEFSQVYNNMGVKVKVIEFAPQVVPAADADAAKEFAKILRKQGIEIETGVKANGYTERDGELHVEIEDVKTGEKRTEVFDKILVAVGRRPRSADLGLEAAGVKVGERGFIPVDHELRTNVPHIFAIGDVIGNPMLAHKAMKEGLVAAEVIAGKKSAMDVVAIPAVVYTTPELAWVGLTEAEAKAKGYNVKTGTFPMSASGRAMTLGDTDGFVKMISDADTDLVLGVHIVAPHGSDMLGEAGLALEMAATVTDISLTVHSHPTLSEAVLEAAENVHKQAIHIINR